MSVARFVGMFSLAIASERIILNLRDRLFQSIIYQETAFFDKNKY
jgi:hypothetical protein